MQAGIPSAGDPSSGGQRVTGAVRPAGPGPLDPGITAPCAAAGELRAPGPDVPLLPARLGPAVRRYRGGAGLGAGAAGAGAGLGRLRGRREMGAGLRSPWARWGWEQPGRPSGLTAALLPLCSAAKSD